MASGKLRSEDEGEPVEQIGGDAMEEVPRRPQRSRRQYKIQEVIKRRQVLLVQVVKEERGNKGAALTTYLSLAGRYSVLMPNTARGGGISRKITNAQDRGRLKAIAEELDVPEGMGVILRTAGASRTKAEVKRDFEYLLRMWETVRETTLASSAPTLVYEEGSLIKRAIRDLYSKEVEEIVVAGETGYREARQFMRLLMPSHVNSVQLYRDTSPVFAKAGVESQLDAMFSNQVTLKSGGYIVINQTEALVAIDVNSGRSTREHNIEDTALRTNLEAADEIARQLRLRDLAGLIVVDFIDMEESRNNRAVERRIKDALKNDRARIQVGRISHFGLLEMSRQRIRTGVLEGSTVVCAHCQGAGVVRSTASIALHVLRVLEDALIKSSTHDLIVRTRTPVALYILNQKRDQSARPRAPVRRHDRRRGGRHADRRQLPCDRARRAGDRRQERSGAGECAGGRHHADHRGSRRRSRQRTKRPSKRQARRMRRPRARATARRFSGRRRGRPATSPPPAPSWRRALVSETASRRTPRSRRTMAWRSSPKSAATSVTPSSEGDAFDRRSPRARRGASPTIREVRAASEAGSGVVTEKACPRPARPASIRLRRSRSRRDSPHPRRITPPPRLRAMRSLRKRRWPTRRRWLPSAEAEVGDAAPSGASAEPNVEPSAPAEAERPERTTPESPPAPEPPRPRRSGWWQRARATVIGS